MKSSTALAAALVLAGAGAARASSQLLFFEAQGVAGYSSAADEAIFYSMNPREIMQKPSVGFDYLGRLSGDAGDWLAAALQMRLAYNAEPEEDDPKLEVQVYNAFLKYKGGWGDLWVGHNRPALGLGAYFDSHALLLRTLAMQGYGFDRDWGAGVYRETEWGALAGSLTTGTGAPVRFNGNWLAAARVGHGVVNRDNWTLGLSAAAGETLETMGNAVLESEPADLRLVALDAALLRDNLEHRVELEGGRLWGESAFAVLYRLGVLLDGEGRWRIEAQPEYLEAGGEKGFQGDLCLSVLATADLTLRLLYSYNEADDDHRVVFQVYYYHQI
ncbi:MAG TPA: hypothetical protein VI078_12825 [bacterium]